jgi:ATP-dependent RNA/DNA helicase IGHMBP2
MKDFRTELGKIAEALMAERKHEQETLAKLLKEGSLKERKEAGLCWSPVKTIRSGFGLGDAPWVLVERNASDTAEHRFDIGTPAAITKAGSGEESLSGTVSSVEGNRMKLSLYGEDLPDWVINEPCTVNAVFDSKTFEDMARTLSRCINTEDRELISLLKCIYENQPNPTDPSLSPALPEHLNQSQREAATHAFQSEKTAVIHGPPGTGKTTTIVALTMALLQEEAQVLICAPSNAATDYITELLTTRGVPVVRIGNISRISESNTDRTVEALIRKEKDWKTVEEYKRRALDHARKAGRYVRQFGQAEREARAFHRKEYKDLLKQSGRLEDYLCSRCLDAARVITSTLTSVNHPHLRNRSFRTLIVDEAGQTTDPALLMALLKAERIILAGDPFQLPPTVKSPEAVKLGLANTALERMVHRTDTSRILREQYRMNQDIMGFSNVKFYDGQLQAHPSVASALLAPDEPAIEIIDTAGCGHEEARTEGGDSRSNPGEADILLKRWEELRLRFPQISIGIISPYKDQVKRLRDQLPPDPLTETDTADAFQGREVDAVILSLVRSNEDGTIGFLSDYRRMNVAITRARKKLIVIGDSATLGSDAFYADFFALGESIGLYRSGWEYAL